PPVKATWETSYAFASSRTRRIRATGRFRDGSEKSRRQCLQRRLQMLFSSMPISLKARMVLASLLACGRLEKGIHQARDALRVLQRVGAVIEPVAAALGDEAPQRFQVGRSDALVEQDEGAGADERSERLRGRERLRPCRAGRDLRKKEQ